MAAQNQVPNPRALAFFMATVMERGEPSEEETWKDMFQVTALDGGPLLVCWAATTTIGDINNRLVQEFGPGPYLGQVNGQGRVVEVAAGWRPINLHNLDVRMGLGGNIWAEV